jgi:hypothetical protein
MRFLVSFRRVLITMAIVAGCPGLAEAEVTIRPCEAWSGVFGGSEQEFSFEIVKGDGALERLTWVFSAKNRTIARGEQSWDRSVDRGSVRLAVPPVRDGVIFPAELKVEIFGSGSDPVARHVKPLWIFPDDPFAGRTAWLAEQQIALFDPPGHTRDVLVEAGVPLHEIHRLAVLDEVREGLVLVGEGVSFRAHRGLAESLLRRAAAGVAVLCLAPADGQWPVPGMEDAPGATAARPASLIWKRAGVIRELDKRLDADGWPPDGDFVASGVRLVGVRGQVAADVHTDGDVWPWYEIRYPGHRAVCVVCGFGIVAHWDAGPAPRFLLARILEYLAE